jgi:hypothetical protein
MCVDNLWITCGKDERVVVRIDERSLLFPLVISSFLLWRRGEKKERCFQKFPQSERELCTMFSLFFTYFFRILFRSGLVPRSLLHFHGSYGKDSEESEESDETEELTA